ncbi:MAG: hypothetical protein GXO85_15955 [Chlorobi bacterium]|nr:hypothetical protein [Chlorobiota bacterium]
MKKLLIYISVFMLLIVAFNEIAQANTGRHYMRIGRLWVIAEYDGAEGWGGEYAWPGGRVRFPNGGIQELWGANVRKLGTTAGCRNWTGPNGTLYGYWTSGMYRTYDYDYLPYWTPQTNQTALFPVTQKVYQRWAQPVVTVNGVKIILDSGEDFINVHEGNTEIDPNLITERAIQSVWRYTMGVEYERWMYGYSTPKHQDYVLNDITLTNNGKMYGLTEDPPLVWPNPDWSQIIENQKVEGFWWAQVENPWNSHLGRDKSFGANDAVGEYIQPFADEGNDRRFYLFYDGDNKDSPEKDWGDPSNTAAANEGFTELLSPAWIIMGALHVDQSATNKVDDPSQPRSTTIKQERDYDLGKIPKTMQDQYEALFTEGNHWPLNTPHNEIDPLINLPSGYRSYGPFDLEFGQSINLVQVVASGGINVKLTQEYGKKAFDADYNGPIMDEIETIFKTGRDSVLKTLKEANWNVNADKGGRSRFDVPDAPRPPANFDVTARGPKIKITWSDESRTDKDFDTGVEDFAGYRLYRAIGARDSVYHVVYDGIDNEYIDEDVSGGFQYFYYLIAYDDGTQNWEDPGVSLESGRWYCWTGWAPEGVSPAVAPITSAGNLEDIRVVPNPYSAAGFTFPGEADKILFTGLPATCTITIYTSAGDYVHKIEHTDGSGNESWDLRTDYNQYIVSDVYIYKIDSDLGSYVDKFIIIR